jgi:hypothetical protein
MKARYRQDCEAVQKGRLPRRLYGQFWLHLHGGRVSQT